MLALKELKSLGTGYTFTKPLTLYVKEGQLACLTVENGNAFLAAIMARMPADGYISIDSERITPRTIHVMKSCMGYLPEQLPRDGITVDELVDMFFDSEAGIDDYSRSMLIREWTALGVDRSVANRQLGKLSSAELRKVCLSMLGVTKKAVILVDNPTKDMESDDRQRVAEYLRQLAADDRLVVAATTDEYIIDKSDVVLK